MACCVSASGAERTTGRVGFAELRRWASLRVLACSALIALVPASADAAGVTLAWDPNPEPDIASYAVLYRAATGLTHRVTVTAPTTSVRVENLTAGVRYYFRVISINTAGLESQPSSEVNGLASDVPVPPPPAPGAIRTYFAEGAQGFFQYRIALLNTTLNDQSVAVTYLREGGAPIFRSYALPSGARGTVFGSDVPELNGTSFAAVVAAVPGVIAERTMRWRMNGGDGASGAKALTAPATQWFLAEGNAGYFQTYVLFANAGSTATAVTVDFLLDGGGVVRRVYTVNANQRYTIWTNQIPELRGRSFATSVRADLPILVERAMYFDGVHGAFEGGHASAAVTVGARNWFLAEGSTGGLFETFVLISNPNTFAVSATVQYLTPSGLARTETRNLPPQSRTTVLVDSLPALESTDVSCSISASDNIVVERSMYWPGVPGPWYGGHNSFGTTGLRTRWGFAEGEVGGTDGADTFVLLANPGSQAASVTLTYHTTSGSIREVTRTVAARSRVTVAASTLGLPSGSRFGVVVESTHPIAAERSVYWNYAGSIWSSGTNETGTPLP